MAAGGNLRKEAEKFGRSAIDVDFMPAEIRSPQ